MRVLEEQLQAAHQQLTAGRASEAELRQEWLDLEEQLETERVHRAEHQREHEQAEAHVADLLEQVQTAQTLLEAERHAHRVGLRERDDFKKQLEVLREALGAIATGTVPPTYGAGAYSHRSLAREALNRVSTLIHR